MCIDDAHKSLPKLIKVVTILNLIQDLQYSESGNDSKQLKDVRENIVSFKAFLPVSSAATC